MRDAGTVRLHKRLTSAHDPAESALIGLDEIVTAAGLKLADIAEIVHGTTLVTNAIIERRGAKLGLITTAGSAIFSRWAPSSGTTSTICS